MHDALDAALEIGLQRDHVAPAALGDDGFLQQERCFWVVDIALQAGQQAVMGDPGFLADGCQPVGSRVFYLGLLGDGLGDRVDQPDRGIQPGGQQGEVGESFAAPFKRAVDLPPGCQRAADIQQLGRHQHTAAAGLFDQGAHIPGAAHAEIGNQVQQAAGFGGAGLGGAGDIQIGGRLQRQGQFGRGAERGIACQAFQDLGVFEGSDGFCVHNYVSLP